MTLISKTKVPHIGPINADIFILGEAPGGDEDFNRTPFVGRSGEFLDYQLSLAGIKRSDCRIGNVCNYRPKDNKWHYLEGSKELDEGIRELTTFLRENNPKVIIALGNEALRFLCGHGGISNWRGSVLRYDKSYVVPTYHPAYALRDGSMAPQIQFDIQRAKKVLVNGYKLPKREFIIDPNPFQIQTVLPRIKEERFITGDIESIKGTTHILCMGFGYSATEAIIFKNKYPVGQLDPEFVMNVQMFLDTCKDITFQNGLFDIEMLRINSIRVPLEKYSFDTMYAQRVLEPELPIGLDFITSLYTDEPYYKDEGKENSARFKDTLWEYNGKDCICTFQARVAQEVLINEDPFFKKTLEFQMRMTRVALMFQENGMLLDLDRMKFMKDEVQKRIDTYSEMFYAVAGFKCNIASHKQVKEILYEKLSLPIRTDKDDKVTSGEDAIVSLIGYVQKKIEDLKTDKGKEPWIRKLGVLKLLLLIRGYQKLVSSYLDISYSNDGRVRSSWKVAGTETGRWSCANYVDGSGFNAQTPPREILEIEVKDASHQESQV